METVTLGMTDLKVSRIAFGAWELGGEWGSVDENAAIATIRHARERGINVFDTAQAYGFGASERIVGRALRDDLDHHREEVVIATKGGLRMTGSGLVRDSSRAWLRQGVDESLRALDVDYIDLYQVHWPDPNVALTETAGPRRAGRRGQDPTRRGLELRRRGDGRVRGDTASGNASAALQLVPPGDRSRRTALHPYTRHRRAGLRTAGPRTADRDHGRTNNVRTGRLAQHQPVVPRRHVPPQSRPGTRPPTLRRRARRLGRPARCCVDARQPSRPGRDRRGPTGAAHRRRRHRQRTAPRRCELTHIDRIMAGTATFTGPSPDAMPTR